MYFSFFYFCDCIDYIYLFLKCARFLSPPRFPKFSEELIYSGYGRSIYPWLFVKIYTCESFYKLSPMNTWGIHYNNHRYLRVSYTIKRMIIRERSSWCEIRIEDQFVPIFRAAFISFTRIFRTGKKILQCQS